MNQENALHHFEDPRRFFREAVRVLEPGGALAVVGSDPHGRRDKWFCYDYFEVIYEADLTRFPRWETVRQWFAEEGLERVERRDVERVLDSKAGRTVLDHPFLRKESCSQLALLTEEEYRAGLKRTEADLVAAEARGETLMFETDILIGMLAGRKAS